MEASGGTLRGRIEQLLQVDPEVKPRVYLQVFKSAEILSLNYALELLFSAGIATLGLVLNSPAVVIGAMLISPLMGPILAAGLALAASDIYLGIKSLISIAASVAVAILFSAGLVWLLPFQMPTAEILARTSPNLLDLGVALLSGLAGSVVVCRGGGGGGITALPGVAIAVALMPPLCTVGFGVGNQMNWNIISGAALLFATNLAAIVASAFVVFYVVRMDAPQIRTKIGYATLEEASPDRLYQFLTKAGLGRSFGDIGHLRWRILMLAVCLAILFVPLRRSLNQLRDETITRSAVRDAIRLLGPPDSILTQRFESGPERILLRLVVATSIPTGRIAQAENILMRRTGKQATVQVRKVASEEELALLRDQVHSPPAPPPPVPQTLDSMRTEALERLTAAVAAAWPEKTAPLPACELIFQAGELAVRLTYQSRAPLDTGAGEILARVLRERLQVDKLRLVLAHTPPQRSSRRKPLVRESAYLAPE